MRQNPPAGSLVSMRAGLAERCQGDEGDDVSAVLRRRLPTSGEGGLMGLSGWSVSCSTLYVVLHLTGTMHKCVLLSTAKRTKCIRKYTL